MSTRNVNEWLFGKCHRSSDCDFFDFRKRHHFDDIQQEADQFNKVYQESYEQIIIKDSKDVEVITTDTKVAASLQAAIQAAIVLVISVSIDDSSKAEKIAQELFQKTKTVQINRQHTLIQNSCGVRVKTVDTDLAINIQLLLQILIALVVKIDI